MTLKEAYEIAKNQQIDGLKKNYLYKAFNVNEGEKFIFVFMENDIKNETLLDPIFDVVDRNGSYLGNYSYLDKELVPLLRQSEEVYMTGF